MKIIIGADLVPTSLNEDLYICGNVQNVIGEELCEILRKADFRVFNLEAVISDETQQIKKSGPGLRAKTSAFNGIKAMNPTVLSIANNHMMDFGEKGLAETMSIASNAGVATVGAGATLADASKTYIKEVDGIKIGIYSCVEHEFSIAEKNKAGCNPYDPLESFDAVENLKTQCDYVIVLYHGGKEYYRYPSPNVQRVCRKFAQKGADIVVCQHSHCIGAREHLGSSEIVYGQGNFVFCEEQENEFFKTGLLISVTLAKADNKIESSVEYVPVVNRGKTVSAANENEKTEIMRNFDKRSEEVLNSDIINKKYAEFADSKLDFYLTRLLGGVNRFKVFKLYRKLINHNIPKSLYSEQDALLLLNYIECEAHRELLVKGLKEYIYKNN